MSIWSQLSKYFPHEDTSPSISMDQNNFFLVPSSHFNRMDELRLFGFLEALDRDVVHPYVCADNQPLSCEDLDFQIQRFFAAFFPLFLLAITTEQKHHWYIYWIMEHLTKKIS